MINNIQTNSCLVTFNNVHFNAPVYGKSAEKQEKPILKDISFSIRENEIQTLIGPNGAGKSTLIKIMLGLLKPHSGFVMKKDSIKIGYMPQKITINSYLPLNVESFLNLYGNVDNEFLALLKVDTLLKLSVHHLSGGEWQRVLFARALINKPDLLVLDEPTQGVDFTGQQDFFKLMLFLKEKLRCSIFLISHDLHYVLSATDQVLCLNEHICCAGRPHEVQNHAEYQKMFGHAKHPFDVVPYRHEHDHCHDTACEHKHT
jgi:zinc transport system ATP-binding protein